MMRRLESTDKIVLAALLCTGILFIGYLGWRLLGPPLPPEKACLHLAIRMLADKAAVSTTNVRVRIVEGGGDAPRSLRIEGGVKTADGVADVNMLDCVVEDQSVKLIEVR